MIDESGGGDDGAANDNVDASEAANDDVDVDAAEGGAGDEEPNEDGVEDDTEAEEEDDYEDTRVLEPANDNVDPDESANDNTPDGDDAEAEPEDGDDAEARDSNEDGERGIAWLETFGLLATLSLSIAGYDAQSQVNLTKENLYEMSVTVSPPEPGDPPTMRAVSPEEQALMSQLEDLVEEAEKLERVQKEQELGDARPKPSKPDSPGRGAPIWIRGRAGVVTKPPTTTSPVGVVPPTNHLMTTSAESHQELANLAHLRRARDLIDREYARPLEVAVLARAALMSTAHFSRQFRAAYGETPYAYLMTRRIERAKALLRRGDLSVTEVCMEVGCTSLGSFSARFTQLVGETPTAYRNRDHGALARVPGCIVKDLTRPSRKLSRIGEMRGAPAP